MRAPASGDLTVGPQQFELQSPNPVLHHLGQSQTLIDLCSDTSDDDEPLTQKEHNDATDTNQEDIIAILSDSSDDLEEPHEHDFNAISRRADEAPQLLEHDKYDEVEEITEADFNAQARRTSANSTRAAHQVVCSWLHVLVLRIVTAL